MRNYIDYLKKNQPVHELIDTLEDATFDDVVGMTLLGISEEEAGTIGEWELKEIITIALDELLEDCELRPAFLTECCELFNMTLSQMLHEEFILEYNDKLYAKPVFYFTKKREIKWTKQQAKN